MNTLLNIRAYHEYHQGICPDIQLLPFPKLWEFERNNRFRFQIKNGEIQVFIEKDQSPLEELDDLCFWVTYTHDYFIYYTQLLETNLNPKKLLKWDLQKNETIDSLLAINPEGLDKKKSNEIQPAAPLNTIGFIQISTEILKEEPLTNFGINFQNKKTYWEYHIYSPSASINFNEWEWSLKDFQKKWSFQLIEQANNKSVFRSIDALPFYEKAESRITLSWQKKNNSLENKKFSKSMPFPNYQHQHLKNKKHTTITYINI